VVQTMSPLFDVDGAGVMLADEEHVLRHLASTDGRANVLESVQESAGRGPCVQALVEDAVVVTSDVLSDPRWADIGQHLAENGVRSIFGAPIHLAGAPLGSLNVYKTTVHDWDESERQALAAFDRLVERLITTSLILERTEVVAGQLQEALRARVEIERAVGIVMVLEDLDAIDAFEHLRRIARSSRQPVREIVSNIIKYKKMAFD
jgi:GAF domain-containing protein